MPDHQPKPITNALAELLGDDASRVQSDLDEFYNWMLTKGKNPNRRQPLSSSLSENYHARVDQVFRFVIDRFDLSDKTELTHDQADLIVKWLDRDEIRTQSGDPYSETSKRKFADALQKYFAWKHDQNEAEKWRPRINFTDGEHEHADKLNFKERWQVLQAAKEYGSLPSYYETSEEERDKIDSLVAQRLGKPKAEVTRKDWERADTSSKVASLIAVALETGIIPIEVERARTDWYDAKRNILKITKEDAGKDRPTTELPLTDETGELMGKWLQERRHYEKYDGTNRLWLNRDGNPYNSKNLCYLLRRLCDEAGIDHEHRNIVWYSLRHNLGQSIEETEDVSQARDQLRHEHIETTKKTYGESTIESRRHTLEKVNETARRAVEDPEFNPYADEPQQPTRENTPQEPVRKTQTETSAPAVDTPPTHIDAVIDDTQEDRADLAQKILSEEI